MSDTTQPFDVSAYIAQGLEGMRAERETLSKKVALLRSEAIDPDLLGIQARKMLNTSHPDELIVYFPNAGLKK